MSNKYQSSCIYSVYIISKSGGLIYDYEIENNFPSTEVEKTFGFPLDIKLEYIYSRLTVTFGQRDNIKVGYALLAINGDPIAGRKYKDKDVLEDYLLDEDNYPVSLKFGLPRLSTNEKLTLASMFHSMYAIAEVQIVPRKDKTLTCTGIEFMETNNFRLNCFQTLTGLKFILLSDVRDNVNKDSILKKIYELYTDFALKNPFYKLEMPIRCDLFDSNLAQLLDVCNRPSGDGE